MSCEYCNPTNDKRKKRLRTGCNFEAYVDNDCLEVHYQDGLCNKCMEYIDINYCPMCGKKI